MVLKFSRLAAFVAAGAVVATAASAHAQCDPSVCGDPTTNPNWSGVLAPRTFTTLKAAKAYCRSEPIVWRATAGGKIYSAKAKGYGKVKPGFYMCRSHAQAVARVNAPSSRKPF
jgi:hypothetical protein